MFRWLVQVERRLKRQTRKKDQKDKSVLSNRNRAGDLSVTIDTGLKQCGNTITAERDIQLHHREASKSQARSELLGGNS